MIKESFCWFNKIFIWNIFNIVYVFKCLLNGKKKKFGGYFINLGFWFKLLFIKMFF